MIQPKDEAIRYAKIIGIKKQVEECINAAFSKGYETCFEQKKEIYQRGYEDGKEFGKIQANALEYQKGYEEGQKAKVEVVHSTEVDDAYKRGLDDCWEVMKHIHLMNIDARKEIFGLRHTFGEIIELCTPSEVKAKIEAWEKLNGPDINVGEIKVGDEVTYKDGNEKCVVTRVGNYGKTLMLLNQDGGWMIRVDDVNLVIKTGRHFDQIAEVLEQMREKEE